jgi:hypothetical protein
MSHALLTFFRSSFKTLEETERFLFAPNWSEVWDIGGLAFEDS